MKLEDFIIANRELNMWKGGTFRYDNLMISIRLYDVGMFEVASRYPAPDWAFSLIFDIRKIAIEDGYLTTLYRWLKRTFFPEIEKALRKYIEQMAAPKNQGD